MLCSLSLSNGNAFKFLIWIIVLALVISANKIMLIADLGSIKFVFVFNCN